MEPPTRLTRTLILTSVIGLMLASRPTLGRTTVIRFPEVLFQENSAEPLADRSYHFVDDHRINTMEKVIADMAMIMLGDPTIIIQLTGHADPLETEALALSLERARHVACALAADHGLPSGRVVVRGIGTDRPWFTLQEIAGMADEPARSTARQLNRRVDFQVIGHGWKDPMVRELEAVRFLSEPRPILEVSYCDTPPTAREDPEADAVEDAPLEDAPGPDPKDGMAAATIASSDPEVSPVLLTDPIEGGTVVIMQLPADVGRAHAEIFGADGRSVQTGRSEQAVQSGRLELRLPPSLAPATYVVRISTGVRAWSLRFVKR